MSEFNTQLPNLSSLEHHIENKHYEEASRELINILTQIDTQFGNIHNIGFIAPQQLDNHYLSDDLHIHFCTQMAELVTRLFRDPNFHITDAGAQRFFTLQRWLGIIFATSPYINADHILRSYNHNPNPQHPLDIHIENDRNTLIKFAILYLPESNVSVNLDALWQIDPIICASLCFALQSPRFTGTPAAFEKRHVLLQWFPDKLAQLSSLDKLPATITHDVYMHCSYDIDQKKHLVKQALNQIIRKYIIASNWHDRDTSSIKLRNGKPVMVVVLEHFHASHSIYRTHSTSLTAAREQFYIIGIGNNNIDEAGRAVFDEFHLIAENESVLAQMHAIRTLCEEQHPAVLYMPSIGMDLLNIFLSNTRLAPIQTIALGHPATTYSDFIEYVVVEDDYVGDEKCFSETLIRLPKNALPYVPSSAQPEHIEFYLNENPDTVHIGIAATTMKLNPYFLEACRAIRDRAKVNIHFHFALGQSLGITHPYVSRFIRSYLGNDATTYAHSPYPTYLSILNRCDMMLNPFPFGNTNGIIDMVTLGLVGICKTGPEVHEHIDQGLFQRLGLPDWLITQTADEYVACAIRLAENHEERLALRRHIIDNNGLSTLFSGDPSHFGNIMREKVEQWILDHPPTKTPTTETIIKDTSSQPIHTHPAVDTPKTATKSSNKKTRRKNRRR